MIFSDAMQSLRNTIVFDSKDYSASRRDAWVYGIVVGWDGPSMRSLKTKFSWDDADVSRLRKLRAAWRAQERKNERKPVK